MNYSLHKVPDEPIIIIDLLPGADPHHTWESFDRQIKDMTRDLPGPHYYIFDVRHTRLDLTEILVWLSRHARHHYFDATQKPRVCFIANGQSRLVRIAVNIASTYGFDHIPVFSSLEDAFDYSYSSQ